MIETLPAQDRKRLLALCAPVELVLEEMLCERGEPARHVYFPLEGFVSLITEIEGYPPLEVGMVGREGMVGAQLALGVAVSPLRAVVQGPGRAWRIDRSAFAAELAESEPLQQLLQRYVYVLMAQLSASAACQRFHGIGPRLARWLLMSQDRARSSTFRLTHEFLAYMLGVRRVGITLAAGNLQRNGLIEYRRGELTVLDRDGLKAAACGCYATDCKSYAKRI